MRHPIRKLLAASSLILLLGSCLVFDSYSTRRAVQRNRHHVHKEDSVAARLHTNGSHVPKQEWEEWARQSHREGHAHSDYAIARNQSAASNQEAGHINMIRDTAAHVKWSADKEFETELMKKCAAKEYDLVSLPKASVIICFHGSETLTRLMHTVHSIVQHSPRQLLTEIILIADNTNTESHQLPLDNYIKFVFPGLAWVHRSHTQLGLIKCRQLGAKLAKGDVVVSMDSHMELRIGWLEPLLYEIQKDRRTMVSPYLDWMTEQDDGSWQYEYGCSRYKTVWYWKDMGFTFMEIPNELKHSTDPTLPITSPVTVGTVWAIDKTFFFEIGGFDTGMNIWGGENIDLPIRVVMAGGQHFNVPCSHAAHCAPKGSRDYRIGHRPEVNYKRVIEALFDQQYKDAIYYYNPQWKNLEIGDISERRSIAAKYPHPFSFYMEHADMEHKAPNVNTLAWDGVRNVGVSSKHAAACLYIDYSTWFVKLTGCTNFDRHSAGLFLTNEGQLHNSNHIIMSNLVDGHVTIGNYVGVIGTSHANKWFHAKDGTIELYAASQQPGSTASQCLEAIQPRPGSKSGPHDAFKVTLSMCQPRNVFQQWSFGRYTESYDSFVENDVLPSHRKTKDTLDFYERYRRYLLSYK